MSYDFYSFVTRGEFKKALRCVSFGTAARSLAQHCVLISERWPIGDPRAVWGLLHDLHECVIGDITKPTRGKLFWRFGGRILGSEQLDEELLGVIQERFGLEPIPKDVLIADRLIVVDEMLQLFDRPRISGFAKRLNIAIKPAPPSFAETLFVERARKLGVDKLFDNPANRS